MREISHLSKINKGSIALRATIPSSIVKALELGPEDYLEWQIDVKKGEARVKKLAE